MTGNGPDGPTPQPTTPPPATPAPGEAQRALTQVCDIVRYVPVALLLDGPSLLPQLAEQGKAHVRNAQFVGRLALREGEARLRRQVDELAPRVVDLLRLVGLAPETPPADGTDAAHVAAEPASAPGSTSAAPSAAPSVLVDDGEAAEPFGPVAPAADELAIPDYESLSASQVVNRLPGLAGDELEAVRRYESAHRGRKTILNKIAQLQAAG
jgi:hypothetical protein